MTGLFSHVLLLYLLRYGALNPFNNLEGIYSTDLEHLPVQVGNTNTEVSILCRSHNDITIQT